MELVEKLALELKIRMFSQHTIQSYLLNTKLFLDFIKKPPETIGEDDIK
ncbi:phage integrase N-terminal SAM-like domain-containing protein [archaeon]|nr:phage integrase N-terminal SAM-like domain-containing protein [archaeon]